MIGELMQLTIPELPDNTIKTVNGPLTIAEWLESEKARLISHGRTAEIRRCTNGLYLAVDRVAE
jgi:hypothetical protein